MLNRPDKSIRDRLIKLETHLNNENPLLIDVVPRFKKLDTVDFIFFVEPSIEPAIRGAVSVKP